MRLFGIRNCGSVKKARDFLDSRNIAYEFIDLKLLSPELSDIKRWAEEKGIEVVLNSKGSTYKKLGLKEMHLDKDSKIHYCHKFPLLLKRPIIDNFDGKKVVIGFDEKIYREIFEK